MYDFIRDNKQSYLILVCACMCLEVSRQEFALYIQVLFNYYYFLIIILIL